LEYLRADDPEMIGPYRLFARLGQGGWGDVYFARSQYGAGVALKTIRPDRLARNPDHFRRRFTREVAAARAVVSEYTAALVDADPHAAAPWFATTYVRGIDLSTAVEQCGGPLRQRTWRVLATGLVDALRAIHAAGLIHRDLKPSNILLANARPYVVDFGIARHLNPDEDTILTGTTPLGTLSFAAPELLRHDPVDSSCDVFALGLVLAYVALNRHPFGPGAPAQIGSNILQGRMNLQGLEPAVERVVRPCLEPDPRNRPGLAELARLLPADVSPDEEEWLPRTLWRTFEERSAIAVDLRDPLRLPGWGPGAPGGVGPETHLSGSPVSGSVTGRSAAPRRSSGDSTAQVGARLRQERELASAAPGGPESEATTLAPSASASASASAPAGVKSGGGPEPAPEADLPGAQYRAAAEAADTEAMRMVAQACKSAGDPESALRWYMRSAEAGNPTGAREAAQLIEQRFAGQRHRLVGLYRAAAEGGILEAAVQLGELLEQRPDGRAEALNWYAKAAARGNGKAAKAVARLQGLPAGVPSSDEELAILREHELPAAQGSVHSMLALGSWYQRAGHHERALHWYGTAASTGHAHAMLLAAQLLANDPKRDAAALDWYRRAAEAGNTAALHWLGRRWRQKGDVSEALARFQLAAAKDHLPSMVEAAELLEQMQRADQALELYRRAAAKGDPGAIREAERLGREQVRVTAVPTKADSARPAGPAAKQTSAAPARTAAAAAPKKAASPAAGPTAVGGKKASVPPAQAAAATSRKTNSQPAVSAKKAGPQAVRPPTATAPVTPPVPVPAPVPAPKKGGSQPTGAAAGAAKARQKEAAALCERGLVREQQGRLEGALQDCLRAESLGDRTAKREVARLSLLLRDRAATAAQRKRLRKQAMRRYRELAAAGDQQSVRALKEFAQAGDPVAAMTLAELDPANVQRWQLRAAEANSLTAMRALAQSYLDAGTEEGDRSALAWLHRAGQTGNTAAILDGARAHERRGEYREAMDWYHWAQQCGDARGTREMSRLGTEHPGVALWRRISERLRRTRE